MSQETEGMGTWLGKGAGAGGIGAGWSGIGTCAAVITAVFGVAQREVGAETWDAW